MPLRPMTAMRSPRLTFRLTPSSTTFGAERLARAVDAQHVAPARLLELEAHVRADEARALGALGLDDLFELLDLLEAALRLLALGGVRPEALHEVLQLADLLLGALRRRPSARCWFSYLAATKSA